MKYGSREWLESQYQGVLDDPWGLDWRYSQFFRYRRMVDALSKVVSRDWRTQRALDVGCATGGFTALMQTSLLMDPALLLGIDIAKAAITRARERYPHIKFEQMEVSECSGKFSRQFDLVTCLEVLYYMSAEDRKIALQNIAQVLRPGGIFLVSSMIGKKPYFTLSTLAELVSTRFSVLRVDTIHLKPTILAEKLLMRMGFAKDRYRYGQNDALDAKRLQRLAGHEMLYRRYFGGLAQSHGYVIARVIDPRC